MPTVKPGLPLLLDALAFAAERHRHQRRKDVAASPYINHPIALARVLAVEARVRDPEILAAALLHDTVEDTETTDDELRARFGARVAAIVADVTDDRTLPKAQRKAAQVAHAAHLSRDAQLVKLADKICNLRDIAEHPPHGWSPRRRAQYFAWAKRVIDEVRGAHAKLEALFDEVHARGPAHDPPPARPAPTRRESRPRRAAGRVRP